MMNETGQPAEHPCIRPIEEYLNRVGYPCPVNGIFDPDTLNAMCAFLSDIAGIADPMALNHQQKIIEMARMMDMPDLIDEYFRSRQAAHHG